MVGDDNELMIITTEGILIRLRCDEIPVVGRSTTGVKLINLDNGIKVATIAKLLKISDDEELQIEEEADSYDKDTSVE